MAKIGMSRAGRQHQPVVAQAAPVDDDLPRLGIDRAHLSEEHGGVALPSQDAAHRPGDVGGRQAGSRHLVKQRLEQVVVVAVDDRDIDRTVGQSLRGEQAAEAGADNDDPGARGRFG